MCDHVMSAVQLVQGHYKEMKALLGEPQQVTVASLEGLGSLSDWWHVFRITQVSLFHNKHIICHEWKFGKEAETEQIAKMLRHLPAFSLLGCDHVVQPSQITCLIDSLCANQDPCQHMNSIALLSMCILITKSKGCMPRVPDMLKFKTVMYSLT